MADVIYMNEDGKAESKFKTAWREAKIKGRMFIETCRENKEATMAVASVAIPGAIEIVKMIVRKSDRKDDEKRRKLDMWDPVEGHWWHLKRELRNYEYLEIEERVRNGESRGSVLEDMGLLKR